MSYKFHPTLFRKYDARGVVGEHLSIEDAKIIGQAFGTLLINNGHDSIGVSQDGRLSAPALSQALIEGLLSTGLDVCHFPIATTPALFSTSISQNYGGAVMVTGSHNGPDTNGFKFLMGDIYLNDAALNDIVRIAESGIYAQGNGALCSADLVREHCDNLRLSFTGGPLNAVWDAGNGACGPFLKELLPTLPGNHKLIHDDVDGHFPNRPSDPIVDAHLDILRQHVLDGGYDLGLAFDGDGDRLAIIDGKGRLLQGDQLLAILARPLLARNKGATILTDIKSSDLVAEDVEAHGGVLETHPTGPAATIARMKTTNAPLAGDLCGHFIFNRGPLSFDDAIFAAVQLLNTLSDTDALHHIHDSLPKRFSTPEMRIPCDDEAKFGVVQAVADGLQHQGKAPIAIDGIRTQTQGGWWLLRASNTEPALVARCEASSDEGLQSLMDQLNAALAPHGLKA